MANPLTNKQVAVLQLLTSGGELTATQAAQRLGEQLQCPQCHGTGEGTDPVYRHKRGGNIEGCGRCHGRGHLYVAYSTAYVTLEQLRKRGLVRRRHVLDEWGDETPALVYAAVPQPTTFKGAHAGPDDPLEALYRAPSAGQ